jgi:hypothetical protein
VKPILPRFLIALVLCCCLVPSAHCEDVGFLFSNGTYTTIAPPGSTGTDLVSITPTGQIVGQYGNNNNISNGFVYSGGAFTTIPTPPDGSTANFLGSQPTGISSSGQLIGVYENSTDRQSGFVYSNGTSSAFAPPGSVQSAPVAINSSGSVVGQYTTSQNTQIQSYLFSQNSFTNLTPPNASNGAVEVVGINNSNQVIGTFIPNSTGADRTGFLFGGGTYTTIAPPGSVNNFPTAINASGQVVGTAGYVAPLSNGQPALFANGYLFSDGKYTTIVPPQSFNVAGINLPPGHGSSFDLSINNAGQIVGEYYTGISKTGAILDGAFLFKNAVYEAIRPPGSISVFNVMENNRGQIVGDYLNGSGTEYGFLFFRGRYTEIAFDGLPTMIDGINDASQIIGTAVTPIPDSLPLFATGLGLIGMLGWWRRRQAAVAFDFIATRPLSPRY